MALDDRQVVVFADAQPGLAYLVRNRLAEAGIDCFIENESLPYGANELLPAVIGPRIVVSEADAAAAREIVAEFRREPQEIAAAAGQIAALPQRQRDTSLVLSDNPEATSGPVCPECGQGRMTECPFCHTSGTDFPHADQPAVTARGGEQELLICATCDEPFAPRYYRRCEWCGHDFGEGVEIEPEEVAQYLNDRVIVAVVAAGAILLVIFAYFSSILK